MGMIGFHPFQYCFQRNGDHGNDRWDRFSVRFSTLRGNKQSTGNPSPPSMIRATLSVTVCVGWHLVVDVCTTAYDFSPLSSISLIGPFLFLVKTHLRWGIAFFISIFLISRIRIPCDNTVGNENSYSASVHVGLVSGMG